MIDSSNAVTTAQKILLYQETSVLNEPDDLIDVFIDAYNRLSGNPVLLAMVVVLLSIYLVNRYGPPSKHDSAIDTSQIRKITQLETQAETYRHFLEMIMSRPDMNMSGLSEIIDKESERIESERTSNEVEIPVYVIRSSNAHFDSIEKQYSEGIDYLILN